MKIPLVLGAAALATLLAAGCAGPTAPVASGTASAEPAAASADAPVVLFLGDSYTEGTALAATELQSRWSTVLAEREGWVEVNAGCNGSGYARRGGECGDSYVERLSSLADVDPDIVIVSGGVNDLGATQDVIEAQVSETFAGLQETFPGARLYAVNGIYYTGETTPPLLAHLSEAVSREVEQAGGTFLDIGDPLLGRPDLMASDGLHPNPAGHALIADLTEAALERAGAFDGEAASSGP